LSKWIARTVEINLRGICVSPDGCSLHLGASEASPMWQSGGDGQCISAVAGRGAKRRNGGSSRDGLVICGGSESAMTQSESEGINITAASCSCRHVTNARTIRAGTSSVEEPGFPG